MPHPAAALSDERCTLFSEVTLLPSRVRTALQAKAE